MLHTSCLLHGGHVVHVLLIAGNEILPSNQVDLCAVSTYGCCRDGVTAAGGPDYQGCDEPCQVGGGCSVVGVFWKMLCYVVGLVWCDGCCVVLWMLCGGFVVWWV